MLGMEELYLLNHSIFRIYLAGFISKMGRGIHGMASLKD
jgi:hypothetical protein